MEGVFSQCRGLIHIQIIHAWRKIYNPKTGKEELETHSFFYESVDEIAWDRLKERNREGFNIYFGMCTRKEEKGDKAAAFEMPGIWLDVDGKHHGSKQEAWVNIGRVIGSRGFDPSVIVDSGNGYHLYLLFKEPEVLNSTEDIYRLEGYVKGVSQLFGGDHTHNVNRIMRLPGFDNVKDPSNPKPCKIVSSNFEYRYDLSDFDPYWVEIKESQDTDIEINDIPAQIPQRFLELLEKDVKLRETWEGKKDNPNDNSGSGKDMALADALIKYEFTDGEMARILLEAPYPKSTERTDTYLRHTIAKARSLRDDKGKEKELDALLAKIEKMIEEADNPTDIEPILSEIEKLRLDTYKEYYKAMVGKKFNVGKKALDKDLRKLRKTLDEKREEKQEWMIRDDLTTLHPSLDIVLEIAVIGFRVPVIKRDKEGKERITTEQRVFISDGSENVRVTNDNHFDVGDIDKKTYWLKSVDSPLPLLSDVWNVDEAHGQPSLSQGIFEEIKGLIKKYLDFDNEAVYDLFTSWVIATYFNRVFNAFPFLFFFGPKDSGKSTALELIRFIAFNAEKLKTVSVACLGDIADGLRGTLCIDQAESLNNPQNIELLGILADSYRKEGGKRRVVLMGKGTRRVLEFDTYCPKAFASTKDLHRDLKDRCIKVPMLRSEKKLPELESWSEPWKKIRGKLYQLFLLKWKEVYNLSQKELSYQGRLKELWKPITVTMQLLEVSQERQDAVQSLFKNLAEGVQEKLSDWEEELFLILLRQNRGQGDTFTVTSGSLLSELKSAFGEDAELPTEQWIGVFIFRFHLATSKPQRKKIDGKLKTVYTLSIERIKNIFNRYTNQPDTSDTRGTEDKDFNNLDGINVEKGNSDTHRYPDANGDGEGITVSECINVGETHSDTQKAKLLQQDTHKGIGVSQGSADLARENISPQVGSWEAEVKQFLDGTEDSKQ